MEPHAAQQLAFYQAFINVTHSPSFFYFLKPWLDEQFAHSLAGWLVSLQAVRDHIDLNIDSIDTEVGIVMGLILLMMRSILLLQFLSSFEMTSYPAPYIYKHTNTP